MLLMTMTIHTLCDEDYDGLVAEALKFEPPIKGASHEEIAANIVHDMQVLGYHNVDRMLVIEAVRKAIPSVLTESVEPVETKPDKSVNEETEYYNADLQTACSVAISAVEAAHAAVTELWEKSKEYGDPEAEFYEAEKILFDFDNVLAQLEDYAMGADAAAEIDVHQSSQFAAEAKNWSTSKSAAKKTVKTIAKKQGKGFADKVKWAKNWADDPEAAAAALARKAGSDS